MATGLCCCCLQMGSKQGLCWGLLPGLCKGRLESQDQAVVAAAMAKLPMVTPLMQQCNMGWPQGLLLSRRSAGTGRDRDAGLHVVGRHTSQCGFHRLLE